MTQTPVQRQLSLEEEARTEARKRLRERTKAAEDKNYCSATVYGKAFMRRTDKGEDPVAIIAERIKDKISSIDNGQPSEYAEDVAHVKEMDPYVLSLITIKMALDHTKMVFPGNTLQYLSSAIGERIYDEYQLSCFQAAHPKEFESVKFYQKGKRKGYAYARQDYRSKMNKVSHSSPKWLPTTKCKVGTWFLKQLMEVTGWLELKTHKVKRKSYSLVVPSQAFLEARMALLERAEEIAICQWPMLCEPMPWTSKVRGGYLDSTLRDRHAMIRTRGGSTLTPAAIDGTPALRMLNRIQKVPYRVNRLIYEVAVECKERGLSIGKFCQMQPQEPPVKPDWDSASDEAKLEYRRARTQIEDSNYTLSQKNYRTNELLFVAKKFVDEEEFWIPWSFDYRGRAYPLCTVLHPQGTDFEKSLLLFAEPGPVEEYWLAFQVATTFGLDKSTMEERQQWVSENHDLISRIANDPLGNLSDWSDTSEPWCFLASCVEYNDCVIDKSRDWSNLPIGVDATCSGLQHLAALTKDLSAASLVNVIVTDKPADAYLAVAEKAKEFLPEKYHPLMNRKVTKRTVMTTPYGVTASSARGYIREELPREFPDGSPVELSLVTKAVFSEAIPSVIPGPIRVMKFIRNAVVETVKRTGSSSVCWVTPSGFPVKQDLRKCESIRTETKLLGSRVTYSLNLDTEEPDLTHHRGASAPNLVHSLDASLLHLTFSEVDYPFTLIHDCILARSCDMEKVSRGIRLKFVELYQKPILQDWAAQLGVEFDESVIIGDLDINQSLNSPYLFC